MDSIQHSVLERIERGGRGTVVTPKDFLDVGTRDAVDQALSRLARQKILIRLAQGPRGLISA
ncbi:MAG TPA: DUF6088 family protein [Phycisphaerae bacterium]